MSSPSIHAGPRRHSTDMGRNGHCIWGLFSSMTLANGIMQLYAFYNAG